MFFKYGFEWKTLKRQKDREKGKHGKRWKHLKFKVFSN